MKLSIKNMVCPRCITVVTQELVKLGIKPLHVQLGEIDLQDDIHSNQIQKLRSALALNGFELLDDKKQLLIEKVKSTIIQQIHGNEVIDLKVNFSVLLQEKLQTEYHYLSNLFSQTVGVTIEQYIILQRIERVKELLVYNELTLSEIAYKLGYSSVQHLSTQFKKVTGATPSIFRELKNQKRISLDQI